MDANDPRVLALAQVIQKLRPDCPGDYAYAYAYAHDYARARAHDYADDYADARAHAHVYARARAPLTDAQKAHVDAAYALLFG